jgi:hypothetical protein
MENTAATALNNLLITRDFDPKATINGKPLPKDADGNSDISQANLFSFEFKTPNKNYGTVVILLGKEKNMTVFYGDNVGRTMESNDKKDWYDFLAQLKNFASRNILGFELDDLSRLKYTVSGMAAIKEGLFEGYYGKKNISYSDQPKQVRLMIKHNRNILEGEPRYRAIEELFVETADGERFRVPGRSLAHGRMLARHVAEGGNPYDAFGQYINNIVTELNTLGRFIRAAKHKPFAGPAGEMVEAAVRHYGELKAKAKHMISQRGYRESRELFDPAEITEADVAVENIRDLFIEQTLDHRIEEALPILAKLQGTKMREADEFESWTNQVMEGPAVDEYMSGKSPALAHFADQLDKGAETNFRKTQQGMAEGSGSLDYDKILNAIAALYGPEIWDNDTMQDLANDLEQAGPTDRELDFIIAKGKLPRRLANTQFTNNDNVQFGEQGVSEGSDRVDSLVTKGLKLMRGPTMNDAIAALKYQVGERDFNERRGFYNFYVRQLVDMYGKKGVAEAHQIPGKDEHYTLRNNIWTVYDGDEIVHEYTPERGEVVGAKKLLARFDDEGYDITHVVSPMGVATYLYGKPEEDMDEGVVAEGMEDSSVASGLTRRIMSQRLDLLKKYGPVKVMAAIDDAAEHFGEPDEIGSSDSYAHMQYVEKALSGMNEQGVAEEINKTTYAEELAEKLFDESPNLQNQDDIIRAGYDMAKEDPRLVGRVDGIFRDEDFPSDFVSVYRYIQHNYGIRSGVEEDLDTDGVMMTKPSNMSSESVDPLIRLRKLAMNK